MNLRLVRRLARRTTCAAVQNTAILVRSRLLLPAAGMH
jgi:hypothetical protein